MPHPFHLAFPVNDLAEARKFYGGLMGCAEGRSSDHWIDFDFFGHQIVAHLSPDECQPSQTSAVDGEQVPVRHFGVVLSPAEWRALGERLTKAGIEFIIEPTVRFKGETGEQGTFFFTDPAGNALEFKCFENSDQLFAR